ncbi:hypothetical protein GCM10010341_80150 [Streptomyces noursei]|nr:hypothetical protein GCM10010341_80150 [Streptomyces noursei]
MGCGQFRRSNPDTELCFVDTCGRCGPHTPERAHLPVESGSGSAPNTPKGRTIMRCGPDRDGLRAQAR